MNFFNFTTDEKSISYEAINAAGRNDGGFNIPKSDGNDNSNFLSEMQINITQANNAFYQKNVKECLDYFKNLEENLVKNESLVREDGHDSMIVDLNGSVGHLLTEQKLKIKRSSNIFNRSEAAYNKFTLDNNLQRPAELKSFGQKLFFLFVVSVIFIVEIGANTYLLNGAIPGGIQGAISLAGVVSTFAGTPCPAMSVISMYGLVNKRPSGANALVDNAPSLNTKSL